LRRVPAAEGVLDFQALSARRFTGELAELADAARLSLGAAEAQPFRAGSLHQIHLRRFFDDPLDRDRLKTLLNVPALVRLVMGDPQATSVGLIDDHVVFEPREQLSKAERWLNGIYRAPADKTSVSCSVSTQCGDGYSCNAQRCEADPPWMFSQEGTDTVYREHWLVFVNPVLRQLLPYGF
jgi:hypothetical protein